MLFDLLESALAMNSLHAPSQLTRAKRRAAVEQEWQRVAFLDSAKPQRVLSVTPRHYRVRELTSPWPSTCHHESWGARVTPAGAKARCPSGWPLGQALCHFPWGRRPTSDDSGKPRAPESGEAPNPLRAASWNPESCVSKVSYRSRLAVALRSISYKVPPTSEPITEFSQQLPRLYV